MIAAGYTASASSTTSGFGSARGRRCGRCGRNRARCPARRLRTRRSRPLPAGVRCGSTSSRSNPARRRHRVGLAPTPSAPARPSGSRRSGSPRRRAAAAHPRGRAAEGDRGVPRRARLPADRAPRADRLPERADDDRACDARQRGRARPHRPHGSTICACPTTEADLGDGFLPAERVRTRHSDLHRLRLERAHRSLRGTP